MKLPKFFKSLVLTTAFTLAGGAGFAQTTQNPDAAKNKITLKNTASSLDATGDMIAETNAKYASIVVDAATGEIISGSQMNRKLHPASTTKLLTAYLVFDALEKGTLTLDQQIHVSSRAATIEASRLGLVAGKTISVKTALRGMLIKSANDASIVLGTAVGGTEANFIKMMNAKAKELGMLDSKFVNTNGLPYDLSHGPKTKASSPQSSVTVADMAVLMQALIRDFPQYYSYLGEQQFTFNGTPVKGHNKMMQPAQKDQFYEYMDGGKTGYVQLAGCNLVCSAQKDGQRLIAVVFGMPTGVARTEDMKRILDNGFEVLENKKTLQQAAETQEFIVIPNTVKPFGPEFIPAKAEVPATPAPQPQNKNTIPKI